MKIRFVAVACVTGLVVFGAMGASTLNSSLVGYWKLAGDCRDYSGWGNHGVNHGVDLSAVDPSGEANGAARFDGMNHYIEVADHPSLHFGTRVFSITARIKLNEDVAGVVGDILSKYDSTLRRGVNFHIAGSSPGYNSVSHSRQVHFGIDNDKMGSWNDCGKPWPSNTLISTLIVYDGDLYTGIADASRPEDACHVFRYAGGTQWFDCGRVGNDPLTPSVQAVVVHKGKLYAGTGVWDWKKAKRGKGFAGLNHVYRYEGGTTWRDCGQVGKGYRVLALASYKGDLYVSDDRGCCYRYDSQGNWILCGTVRLNGKGGKIYSMMIHQGVLYGGENRTIYRYDAPATWTSVADTVFGETQIHTLQVFRGQLHSGSWPVGKVLRYEGGKKWVECGHLGIGIDQRKINEVNDLTVYNGKLYAGVIPKGQVWRYEDGEKWTLLKQLVPDHADWSKRDVATWNRIPCLTVFQGRLYAGTSTCHGRADANALDEVGRVYCMEAGKNVSSDKDLGSGWHHVAAVREGNRLRLFVDGKLRATSTTFNKEDYDITNDKPLLIGFGAANYFSGSMCELRVYNRALSTEEIKTLNQVH